MRSPPGSATRVAPEKGRHSPAQWALQSTNSGRSADIPTVTASQSPSWCWLIAGMRTVPAPGMATLRCVECQSSTSE